MPFNGWPENIVELSPLSAEAGMRSGQGAGPSKTLLKITTSKSSSIVNG